MSIQILNIKSYTENKIKNIISITPDELADELLNQTSEYSTFELLTYDKDLKIYLDIEKIPKKLPTLIDSIIHDLIEFVKQTSNYDLGNYILTFNNGSTKDCLSYHLIFYEYYTNIPNIKNMINNFLQKYTYYRKFIDGSVYSKSRLFRCINRYGVEGNQLCQSSIHLPLNTTLNKSTLLNSIIQNVTQSKKFDYEYDRTNRGTANYVSPTTLKMIADAATSKEIVNVDWINELPDEFKNVEPETFNDVLLLLEMSGLSFNSMTKIKIDVINNTPKTIDDDIYIKALTNKSTNSTIKELCKDIIEYYEKHFQTLQGFKYSIKFINSLI